MYTRILKSILMVFFLIGKLKRCSLKAIIDVGIVNVTMKKNFLPITFAAYSKILNWACSKMLSHTCTYCFLFPSDLVCMLFQLVPPHIN